MSVIKDCTFVETKTLKDFGAIGDGVTDDSEALQKAFDWVAETGGKIGRTPGTFRVKKPIEIK
jgi:plasmin/fibronectin-binding protein A